MQNYKIRLEKNIKYFRLLNLFGGMIFIVPIWLAFERQFLTFTQIGILEAVGAATITLLELPTGALADLIGRRKTILIGIFLSSLSNFGVAFSSQFSHFLIAMLIFGLSEALISGANTALFFDSLKELKKEKDFTKLSAKNSIYFRIAFMFASIIGGYLFSYNQKAPFILMSLAQLSSAIWVYKMIEPKIDSEKFNLTNYLKQTRDGFAQIFKTSYMLKLAVFYAIMGGIAWSAGIYLNQSLALELGFSEIQRGWLFSSVFLLSNISILFLTHNDKIITRNRVYTIYPIILILSLLPAIFADKILAYFMLFGISFSNSCRFSILDRYTNKEFESKYRATAISALNMLVQLVYVIIIGSSGIIQDLYSTRLAITLVGILTALLALPSGISLVKEYNTYKANKAIN